MKLYNSRGTNQIILNDVFFGTTSTEFFRNHGHFAHDMYWKMRRIYGTVATTLKKQQTMLKKQYDRSAHITKYISNPEPPIQIPHALQDR